MKKPLTDKERAILEFVISATRLNGYPPSVRDICAETGIKSTSTVFSYIKRLEEKGYLEKEDGKSRSIRTKADPAERNSIRVPLIGDVAAGRRFWHRRISAEKSISILLLRVAVLHLSAGGYLPFVFAEQV